MRRCADVRKLFDASILHSLVERAYCAWLRRYCDFVKGPPLHDLQIRLPRAWIAA